MQENSTFGSTLSLKGGFGAEFKTKGVRDEQSLEWYGVQNLVPSI